MRETYFKILLILAISNALAFVITYNIKEKPIEYNRARINYTYSFIEVPITTYQIIDNQIIVTTKDGTTYRSTANNIILIKE